MIGTEEFRQYEKFVHRQFIRQELIKAKQSAISPDTQWLSEDEFWTGFEESI